jgi:phosphoribosylformylglycinamidine synthase subunit PurQ / glutaminase
LPGAVLQNSDLRFHSEWVHIRVESGETAWTGALTDGQILTMPVAHGQGNYFADHETIADLEHEGRVVFRYSDADGHITEAANINGSINGIAGICNPGRNVVGLMPHPERAADPLLGPTDGLQLLSSVTAFLGSLV